MQDKLARLIFTLLIIIIAIHSLLFRRAGYQDFPLRYTLAGALALLPPLCNPEAFSEPTSPFSSSMTVMLYPQLPLPLVGKPESRGRFASLYGGGSLLLAIARIACAPSVSASSSIGDTGDIASGAEELRSDARPTVRMLIGIGSLSIGLTGSLASLRLTWDDRAPIDGWVTSLAFAWLTVRRAGSSSLLPCKTESALRSSNTGWSAVPVLSLSVSVPSLVSVLACVDMVISLAILLSICVRCTSSAEATRSLLPGRDVYGGGGSPTAALSFAICAAGGHPSCDMSFRCCVDSDIPFANDGPRR